MKHARSILLALFVVAAMVPLSGRQAPDGVPRISLADFKKAFDARAVVVIDVRDPASYAAGHIPGAILVPPEAVAQKAHALRGSKKPIVAYCG